MTALIRVHVLFITAAVSTANADLYLALGKSLLSPVNLTDLERAAIGLTRYYALLLLSYWRGSSPGNL